MPDRLKQKFLNGFLNKRRERTRWPRHRGWARLGIRCFLRMTLGNYKKIIAKILLQLTMLNRPRLHQPTWMISMKNSGNHCAWLPAYRQASTIMQGCALESNNRRKNTRSEIPKSWGRFLILNQILAGTISPWRSRIPESFLTFRRKMLPLLLIQTYI